MGDTAALEVQIAFVEEAVQAMDDALAGQQQHILRLERQIDRLQKHFKNQSVHLDEVAADTNEPTPPHY